MCCEKRRPHRMGPGGWQPERPSHPPSYALCLSVRADWQLAAGVVAHGLKCGCGCVPEPVWCGGPSVPGAPSRAVLGMEFLSADPWRPPAASYPGRPRQERRPCLCLYLSHGIHYWWHKCTCYVVRHKNPVREERFQTFICT